MPTLLLVFLLICASAVYKLLVKTSRAQSGKRNSSEYDYGSRQPRGNTDVDDIVKDNLHRTFRTRRSYYRDVYLQSDAWQRKRYLVFRRDNWRCVYCGSRATQVHHKRYAKRIGREPIEWLVSVCKPCHDQQH